MTITLYTLSHSQNLADCQDENELRRALYRDSVRFGLNYGVDRPAGHVTIGLAESDGVDDSMSSPTFAILCHGESVVLADAVESHSPPVVWVSGCVGTPYHVHFVPTYETLRTLLYTLHTFTYDSCEDEERQYIFDNSDDSSSWIWRETADCLPSWLTQGGHPLDPSDAQDLVGKMSNDVDALLESMILERSDGSELASTLKTALVKVLTDA